MARAKLAFYGIDLGTTHTVVVKATKEGNSWKYTRLKLPNMPVSELDDIKETELLPSAVYFPKEGMPIVGEYAKEAIYRAPERVYINSKIDLGGSLRKDQLNEHTPQEVSTEILKVCYAKIIEDGGANAPVRISVPAAFSRDKRIDTENAAKQAALALGYNIKLVRTTEEPFAALLNLTINEKQFIDMIKTQKNTVMLIDIGGGTMDVIICDFVDQGSNIIKASTPYEPAKHDEFAGARFDFEIMKKFMQNFLNYYEVSERDVLDEDKVILEKRMLLIAEEAKKFLCNKENVNRTFEFTWNFDIGHIECNDKPPFQVSLTKREMDIILDGLLNSRESYGTSKSINRIIKKTLKDNNLSPNDIDCIYLTGGMAKYDQISQTIKSVIRKPVIVAEEPLFCTAVGVALSLVIQSPDAENVLERNFSSNRKTPEESEISEETDISKESEISEETDISKESEISEEKDNNNSGPPSYSEHQRIEISESKRMGMSYFIDVENHLPVEIIPKDETYPCFMKKSNLQFKTSSQSRMTLVLYEGHSVYDCNMRLLRQQTVEFTELTDIGTTIDISYKIDTNKIITIYASINGEPPFEFSTDEG